ncbi:MAG TPA: TIR domain-containing protein [Sphingomicrobium sp.]|nr:TIR domain-containing protein [Sphingomicrobium sp.]
MARIFLSYARDDVDAARQLAEGIGGAGHDVWWDRHLHGGSRFASEIDRELKSSDAVVVLWTPSSIESAWVQDEAAEGRDTGRLVPVTLGAVKPPLGFRQFHTVDLGSSIDKQRPDAIDDLLAAIAQTCGPASARSKPAAPEELKPAPKTSICVLPFENMSGDAEQEYFSDGITEDIITDLSRISAFSVVARNTAFRFKGKDIDLKDVAHELGVTHVLEGSVRKAGTRVRITAQLIDGTAGDHVWAERYDRDLTDIFAIQDEISKAIADAMKLKLLPRERKAIEQRGTNSVDAYNLYLMARQHWISGNLGDKRREEAVVRICRQAVAVDPDYSRAWALMALAQSELRFLHGQSVDAFESAERALSLDPDLAEAHCVKARFLEEEGHQEDAKRQIETALRLDPESWEVNKEAARLMFRQGRVEDALVHFEKASSLMDSDYHDSGMMVTCYKALGDEAGVRSAAQLTLTRAEKAIAQDPGNTFALGYGAVALASVGDVDRAKEWAKRAILIDPDNLVMRYNLACAFTTYATDFDSALEFLAPYFERASLSELKHCQVDPDIDPIRDNPTFKEMQAAAKQRLGMSAAAE